MIFSRPLLPFLFLIYFLVTPAAGETHCQDPADCPLYPIHSCFATTAGMVCRNKREYAGFEVSMNLIETFNYSPLPANEDDDDKPCYSIPHSPDLLAYLDARGSQVLEMDDLALIGNCSRQAYCDKTTRTCRRKHGLGSPCQYNMECAVGTEYLPGHCNPQHNATMVCGLRQDIPSFYYGAASLRGEWKLGKHWMAATIAVVLTGIGALILLIARHLVKKWRVVAIEKWGQEEQTAWWRRWLTKPAVEYVPLDARPVDPPPYRGESSASVV